MCSFGACCEQAEYECGIQIVGKPSVSANTSLGNEPPRFGRIAGFFPVVRVILSTAHFTHFESGSSRVACMASSRAGVMTTCGNPSRTKCRCNAGIMSRGSMPTTNRKCARAHAMPAIAFTGKSGLPAFIARIEKLAQPYNFSAADNPGSPQSASIDGAPSPPLGAQSCNAYRTDAGISAGRHSGTRIAPCRSVIVAIACARTIAGSAIKPPQLPE